MQNCKCHATVPISLVFTALHEMYTRSCDENSVCPSVCLSVTRVIPDKMEERSVQIFLISYERLFSLVFSEEEWLMGATPSMWNFGSTCPRWSEIADFNNNNNNNRSFNMVKTHAQPYKHIKHTNTPNSLSRRTAITRPTHCHAGQQQHKVFSTGE